MAAVRRAVLLTVLALASCEAERPKAPPSASASSRAGAGQTQPKLAPEDDAPRYPAPRRVVAIGDLHGDLAATKAVLRAAGAIDDKAAWIGGDLVVVQTGDQLDRGDDERAILDLLDRLVEDAKKAGGALHVLNGNHEVMNVALDFRYVTEGGFKDFADVPGASLSDPKLVDLPLKAKARGAAFLPGGPYAQRMAPRHLSVIVGDTVFVHGGVLPKHARYGLGKMEKQVRAWMEGKAPSPPSIVTSEDGPIWVRRYSAAPDKQDCAILNEALEALSVKRMVVGHTVQRGGISPGCEKKVWRIDVGLAAHYGGPSEALEIVGDEVRTVRGGEPAPKSSETGQPASSAAPAASGEPKRDR
jgi:Calcineurin-like phosphoesterase